MNGYTANFEGAFCEMVKPDKPKNITNIFKNLNSTKEMKYSSFPKEVEDILEDIKVEGVQIVS